MWERSRDGVTSGCSRWARMPVGRHTISLCLALRSMAQSQVSVMILVGTKLSLCQWEGVDGGGAWVDENKKQAKGVKIQN